MLIPIINQKSERVARVEFTRGQGRIVGEVGHKSEADNARNAVGDFAYLNRMDAMTEIGLVRYWDGFWGWLAGAMVSLYSVGLGVDIESIVYPKSV